MEQFGKCIQIALYPFIAIIYIIKKYIKIWAQKVYNNLKKYLTKMKKIDSQNNGQYTTASLFATTNNYH